MGVLRSKITADTGYFVSVYFEYYIITKFNVHTSELTCAVYPGQMNACREIVQKELRMSISPTPGADGFHHVTIRYYRHNKPCRMVYIDD